MKLDEMSLKRAEDFSAFDWIGRAVDPILPPDSPDWCGNTICHLLPRLFSGYCKVLHPIFEDPLIEDRTITWNEWAGERGRKRASGNPEIEMILDGATLIRGTVEDGQRGSRVLWRSLCSRYGVIFRPELSAESFRRSFRASSWPRYLIGPDEGTLDSEACEALVEVFAPVVGKQKCYFLCRYYGQPLSSNDARLYEGRLDDVVEVFGLEGVTGSPNYWWSEDHSWAVCTDCDLSFTVVGASERVVSACVAHPELECIRVFFNTRIDCKADEALA